MEGWRKRQAAGGGAFGGLWREKGGGRSLWCSQAGCPLPQTFTSPLMRSYQLFVNFLTTKGAQSMGGSHRAVDSSTSGKHLEGEELGWRP